MEDDARKVEEQVKLSTMEGNTLIDIHTHILPGLDDGAQDITESIAMARTAVKDGITTIVATPHVRKGVFKNDKHDIMEAVNGFNQILQAEKIPACVLPGAEYHLEPTLGNVVAREEIMTINDSGRYILVEFPSTFLPAYSTDVLYNLQLQGLTPIIAHPERNRAFVQNPLLLRDFLDRGMLAQITSGSICGLFGNSARKASYRFIKAGMGHVIASDAHSSQGRAPVLSEAYNEIKRNIGIASANILLIENSKRIIEGLDIEPTPQYTKMNWWRRFCRNQ